MRQYHAWKQEITQSGRYRAGANLQPTQLGGYHLIECHDLDKALAVARRIPTLDAGGVIEVRLLDPAI